MKRNNSLPDAKTPAHGKEATICQAAPDWGLPEAADPGCRRRNPTLNNKADSDGALFESAFPKKSLLDTSLASVEPSMRQRATRRFLADLFWLQNARADMHESAALARPPGSPGKPRRCHQM